MGSSIEKLHQNFSKALRAYGKSLNFSAAAKAQGVSRAQLVSARAADVDLDAAFCEVENRMLDGIEQGVIDRAADSPGEAQFVLRSKRPKEWGGNDKGPGGSSQLNIQVNLFAPETEA